MNATVDRLVRLPEVISRIGVSRPTVYRLIADGKFPKAVKQGRTSSWPVSEIEAYLEEVKGAR